VLGDTAGLAVGLLTGDLVGLFAVTADGLRVGEEAGAIDRRSTGAGVSSGSSGSNGVKFCVGTLVALLLGDAAGLAVGLPAGTLVGELVGLFAEAPVGPSVGAETGGIDRPVTGAGVSGAGVSTG
jgi:hypothetical protein